MIKYILLFSFIVVSNSLFAQEEITKSESSLSWAANLHVSSISRSFEEDLAEDTGKEVNFGVGLDIFYPLSDRLELKSGIGIARHKFNERNFDPLFGTDFDPGTLGASLMNSYSETSYKLTYLSVPVELRIYYGQKPKGIYLTPGIQINYQLEKNISSFVFNNDTPTVDITDFIKTNKTQLATLLALGYQSKKEKFASFFEAGILYYLTALNQDEPLNAQSTELELRIKAGVRF